MTASSKLGDQVKVTVSVAVPLVECFDLFTRDINLWWRRGLRFRHIGGDRGLICIEPRVGGRVFESALEGTQETVILIGLITQWEPPHSFSFNWRNEVFAPNEWTQVEVSFTASAQNTQVTVIHRGWSLIRDDHPARHGMNSAAFIRSLGLWWGDQLSSLRVLTLTSVQ